VNFALYMYSIPSPWLHTHPLHKQLISFATVSQRGTNYTPVRIYFSQNGHNETK